MNVSVSMIVLYTDHRYSQQQVELIKSVLLEYLILAVGWVVPGLNCLLPPLFFAPSELLPPFPFINPPLTRSPPPRGEVGLR